MGDCSRLSASFRATTTMVVPKLTSALAARGGEDVEVAHFGHFGILFSHTVTRHIAAVLGPSLDGAAKTTTRVLEGAPVTNETASLATTPLDTDATKEAEVAEEVDEASSNERADGERTFGLRLTKRKKPARRAYSGYSAIDQGAFMRRFEYRVGSSNKFWEISPSKSTYAVRYGRIGTDGQSSEKAFASNSEAKRAYEKIVAEKVKSGYVEVMATTKGAKPAASDKKTSAKTAAASGEDDVHDRASFEKAFGPIKKVGAVNNGLLDCRLPGENYYAPDRNATPPLFTSRLWTTGFFPKDADGTSVSDWRGLGEAVSIARRIAAALKGVVLSSDTDSLYYPFVFPEPFDGKGLAKYVHGALGCQAKGARHFELEKTKNPENLFWESDEEPEEYFSEGDVKRCRAAAAIFRTLESPVLIRMTEDFVTSPQLLAGRAGRGERGFLVGVIAFRVDT